MSKTAAHTAALLANEPGYCCGCGEILAKYECQASTIDFVTAGKRTPDGVLYVCCNVGADIEGRSLEGYCVDCCLLYNRRRRHDLHK